MKKIYTRPETIVFQGKNAGILCASTFYVKGIDYNDETMTDLSRRARFYRDDEFEDEDPLDALDF